MNHENLRDMKTGEVQERARQAGIDPSGKDKSELIDALEQRGQGGSERFNQPGGGQEKNDPAPKGASPGQYKNVPGNQT